MNKEVVDGLLQIKY